jgi:hypothetical protein
MTWKHAAVLGPIAAVALACGTRPIAYPKAGESKASEQLIGDVELFYAGKKAPEGADILDHIKEKATHTDCETAAVMAIVKMQKEARFMGGNALVNLKTVKQGGKPSSNAKGFWCSRKGALEEGGGDVTVKVWSITWEGDIAVLQGEGEETAEETETAAEEDLLPETPPEDMVKPKKGKKAKKAAKKTKKAKPAGQEAGGGSDMTIDPSEVEDDKLQLDDGEGIY